MKFENLTDAYKLGHRQMYPAGTQYVYSNFTPRTSRIPEVNKVVFFGLQAAILNLLGSFQEFLDRDIDEICADYEKNVTEIIGPNNVGSDHFRALHKLGYLPLEIHALPEGTLTPLGVPMFTIRNTHPDFFWLTNYLETYFSTQLWLPCTSATTSYRVRQLLNDWALKTSGTIEGVEFQAHDFSMRGMSGVDAAAMSGAGHLISFVGSDCLPAKDFVKQFYDFDIAPASEPLAMSVPATEHSVMCSYGSTPDDELRAFETLIDTYPAGFLSVVSDAFDFWGVVTEILPALKDKIMARDGKLVIRPDSGDPADILCGLNTHPEWNDAFAPEDQEAEEKGLIEILWEIFGGTVNEQGYKVLDSHIGSIYGDSITYERAQEICERLAAKGFASSNVVLGLGSFSFQYVTRDTFGFAVKATHVTINGEDKAIFKDPKTGSGKKSAKGLIAVVREGDSLVLKDNLSRDEKMSLINEDQLNTVYIADENGVEMWVQGFDDVKKTLAAQ